MRIKNKNKKREYKMRRGDTTTNIKYNYKHNSARVPKKNLGIGQINDQVQKLLGTQTDKGA
jgi:hypothetical protein